jgi:hypothetical protein
MSSKGYFASGKVDASIPADHLQFHHRLPFLSERSLEHCSSAPHIHVREADAEKVEPFTGVLARALLAASRIVSPVKYSPLSTSMAMTLPFRLGSSFPAMAP